MLHLSVTAALVVASISCGVTSRDEGDRALACRILAEGEITGPHAELCRHLADRYATLVDTLPMPGELHSSTSAMFRSHDRGDSTWGMDWPRDELFPQGLSSPFDSGGTENLFHEIGHQWLSPLMRGGRAISIGVRYGTEAPDWLDEAWAMWAPFAHHRQNRQARLDPAMRPSLRKLVSMSHPVSGPGTRETRFDDATDPVVSSTVSRGRPCPTCDFLPDSVRNRYRVEAIRLHESGKVDTILELSDSMPPEMAEKSYEEERFYPLSYSLLRYIRETGGEAAVRELIARYRVDPTPRAEALAGLPGLPASLDALEAGWHAFIAERRPEPK